MAPDVASPRAPVGLSSERVVLLRAKLLCELAEQLQQGDEARATAIALTGQSDVDSLLEREVAGATASRAAAAASEVQHALARLEIGTYGCCEGCGAPIPFERLEVIPHTRRCTGCSSSGAPPRGSGSAA
ncbi:MAG TPA: TraR/DksA C4-type zinc finger protein [Acidimicrobiales bacterium]|nr:TraR/DksA C4-type zinc finger protein [Acidimicrobiales bacterium]